LTKLLVKPGILLYRRASAQEVYCFRTNVEHMQNSNKLPSNLESEGVCSGWCKF